MITPSQTLWHHHKRTLYTVLFVFLYSVSLSYAVPPTTKYAPGSTLDPLCTPGSTNCSVRILPEQSGNTNTYLTTDGADTAWSSSTLILGGNFQTSGAYATTLTTTGTTALTLPTTGTLATTANINTAVSGTLNYVPKFTGTNTVGNSLIYDNGTSVAIGTTTPFGKFMVVDATVSAYNSANMGAYSTATIMNYSPGDYAAIFMQSLSSNGVSAGQGVIGVFNETTNAATSMTFGTRTSGAVITEKMRITSTGNVGIGDTSPASMLTVGSGDLFQVTSAGAIAAVTGITTTGAYTQTGSSTNTFSGRIVSTQGNSTRFFESTSATTGYTYAQIKNTGGEVWLGIENSTGGQLLSGSSAYATILSAMTATSLHLGTNSSIRFTIDASGNLIASDLAGSGNRCLYADSTGQINVKGFDCGSASGGDNLGDHVATQNITLGSNWLSGDGGAEGLRVDASGNVGIQTASPAAALNVTGTSMFGNSAWPTTSIGQSGNRVLITDTSTPILTLNNANATVAADNGSSLLLGARATTATNDSAYVRLFGGKENATSGNYSSYLAISTLNGTDGTQFERMRIAANGNMGIGTIAPGSRLDVTTTSGASPIVAQFGDTTHNMGLFLRATSTNFEIQSALKNDETNEYPLVINPDGGNVGIGTSTPTFALGSTSTGVHIKSIGSTYATLNLQRNSDSHGSIIDFSNASNVLQYRIGTNFASGGDKLHFAYGSTPTIGMTMDTSGNVGIGTTSPGVTRLYVENNAAAYGQFIYNAHASGNGLGIQAAADSSHYALAVATNNNNPLFYVRGDGNVGVGTSSPGNKFHVMGTTRISNSDGVSMLYMTHGATTGTTYSEIDALVGSGGGYGNLVFQSGGGNVGIGTTSPSYKFVVSNAGANGLEFNPVNGGITGTSSDIISYNRSLAQYTSFRMIGSEILLATSGVINGIYLGTTGQVGIGTATPAGYKLNIEHNDSLAVRIRSTGGTDNAYINFNNLQGSAVMGLNGGVGQLLTGSVDGAFAINNMTGQPIHISADTGQVASEGVTILEDGRVGIGTIAPSHKLDLVSNGSSLINMGANRDASGYAESGLIFEMNGSSNWENYIESGTPSSLRWYNYQAAVQVMSLNSSGNLTVVSLTQTSDQRLKDNIASIDDSVMEDLLALRPVTYNMNTGNTDLVRAGFIAQEVQDIFPDLIEVGDDENNTLSLNYIGLIPYVVKGIQEMNIKIQALPEFEDDGSMATAVADFLRGIANGIASIGEVQTSKLCVDDICVTRDQFLNMVESSGQEPTPEPTPEPIPEPAPDPVVEPEPTPEPVPEPEPTPEPAP